MRCRKRDAMKVAAAVLAFSVLGASWLGGIRVPVVAAQASARSASEGVYTHQQASRGQASFTADCNSCHPAMDDTAGEAPSLSGPEFLSRWAGRSVGDILVTMRTTMPPNAAGSLAKDTYVDILAYVLSANGYPPGTTELGAGGGRWTGLPWTGKGADPQLRRSTRPCRPPCSAARSRLDAC